MVKRHIVYEIHPSGDEIASRAYCHTDSDGNKMITGNELQAFKDFLKVLEQYEGENKIAEFDIARYSAAASAMGSNAYFIYALLKLDDGRYVPYFWLSGFHNIPTALDYLIDNPVNDPTTINVAHFVEVYFGKYLQRITSLPKEKMAGAIIDVRENGGGAVNDLSNYVGQFLGKSDAFWESRHKEGLGRHDMSAYVDDSIKIWDNAKIDELAEDPKIARILLNLHQNYGLTAFHRDFAAENIPVVCLADLYSLSCAEVTAGSIKSIPTGYVIGERTSGGHGILENNDLAYNINYNGVIGDGNLQKYNFYIYTSNYEQKLKGQPCYEGIGITPDQEVLYNDKGYKGQLDAALEYIANYK